LRGRRPIPLFSHPGPPHASGPWTTSLGPHRRPGRAAPPARPHPPRSAAPAPAELAGGAGPGSRGTDPRTGAVGGGSGRSNHCWREPNTAPLRWWLDA